MRLFIAINFTPEIKLQLSNTIQELRNQSQSGTFTHTHNLHLTLAFLGEVWSERVPDILKTMNDVVNSISTFPLELGDIGKFANHGQSIYWCGIQENAILKQLQHTLISHLITAGFAVDGKPFKPHITLGRRCKMNRDFDELAFARRIVPMRMPVASLELMLSERIDGQLVYTSLGQAKLNDK